MKRIHTLLFLTPLMALLFMAAHSPSADLSNDLVGQYGTPSASLTLHENGTFEFLHGCNGMLVKGDWAVKGNTVKLTNLPGEIDHLPTRWKVDRHHPCLRSAMTNWEVLRLCRD